MLGAWHGSGQASDVVSILQALSDQSRPFEYAKGCDIEGTDTSGFADAIELGDTFTLASANVLSGSFDNVTDGGMLRAGSVSFDVHYPLSGQNLVVQVVTISSVPEPSSVMLLMLAGPSVVLVRRRKCIQSA